MHDLYDEINEEFLSGNIHEPETYKHLLNRIKDCGNFVSDWEDEDLEDFIKSTGAVSINTVNKYLQFVRTYYKYVCGKLNIPPKSIKLNKDLKYYIDLNKLMAVTLSENNFKFLKNLLTVQSPYGEYNFRDKVLLELAWEGLTNTEIKHLKVNDISFYKEFGVEKAELRLKTRNIIIDDSEVIYDIKKAIEQKEYFREERNGRNYFVHLKDTPMLIKPIAMRVSDNDAVSNPSILLQRVLQKLEDEFSLPGINLSDLSLEDIRRSRIIDLLKHDTIGNVKMIYDKKASCDLYWLEEIAILIRREEMSS